MDIPCTLMPQYLVK